MTSMMKTAKMPKKMIANKLLKESILMAPVVSIRSLAEHVDEEVTIQGWLYNKTGKGRLQFLQVRDGTGLCQAVLFKKNVSPEDFAAGKELTQESSLRVTGRVKADERAPGIPGGYELDATALETVQISEPYPISPKDHGVEFLMQNRHLWLRSSRQWAAMRVRAVIIQAIRQYLDDNGYINIDTPILTPAAAEGTTTLFGPLIITANRPTWPRRGSSTTRPTSSPLARSTASGPPSAPKRARHGGTSRSSGWSNRRWPSAIWMD